MRTKRFISLITLFAVMTVALFTQNTSLPRLAVVPFSTNMNNERIRSDATTVRNLVESHITKTNRYTVVTRNEIDTLIANQRIQISDIASLENRKRLELVNISYVITGSVDATGNDYVITVRVLDVSTGQYPHMDSALMGNSSQALFNGVNAFMEKFVARMTTDENGGIIQGTGRSSVTGISIEVSTKEGGIVYFQGNEIATLWGNDTYTIAIERPGTYTVKMTFGNGREITRSVVVSSRGITKVDFSILQIGDQGPAGGIIFYDKGSYSNGWRYLEAAPANTEFMAEWGTYTERGEKKIGRNVAGTSTEVGSGRRNTQLILEVLRGNNEIGRVAQKVTQLNINGFTDWFLPSKDELNLMFMNLRQRGFGGFSTTTEVEAPLDGFSTKTDSLLASLRGIFKTWYWSSSQSNSDSVWQQDFGRGSQFDLPKYGELSVRAVRAF